MILLLKIFTRSITILAEALIIIENVLVLHAKLEVSVPILSKC